MSKDTTIAIPVVKVTLHFTENQVQPPELTPLLFFVGGIMHYGEYVNSGFFNSCGISYAFRDTSHWCLFPINQQHPDILAAVNNKNDIRMGFIHTARNCALYNWSKSSSAPLLYPKWLEHSWVVEAVTGGKRELTPYRPTEYHLQKNRGQLYDLIAKLSPEMQRQFTGHVLMHMGGDIQNKAFDACHLILHAPSPVLVRALIATLKLPVEGEPAAPQSA